MNADMPANVQETLLKHEAAGTTDDPAYQEAMLVFYRRHLCRLDPWPDCLNRTFEKLLKDPEVYNTMNGPSEFHVTGVIKDWDIVNRLGEIPVPTLVISGRYDEATPVIAETPWHTWIGMGFVREKCPYAAPRRNRALLASVDEFLGSPRATDIAHQAKSGLTHRCHQ